MTDMTLSPSLHASGRTRHGLAARVLDVILTWQHRAASRRQLAQMNGHDLADIGIGPGQALAEADKPFWRG